MEFDLPAKLWGREWPKLRYSSYSQNCQRKVIWAILTHYIPFELFSNAFFYRGRFHYCDVAVKQMHDAITGLSRYVFEREVNMASKCHHPCLLLLMGATNNERPLLVTEPLECSQTKEQAVP